jgi:hypothetical protein
MRRREFIGLLGSAAAWPLAARAQQAGKLATVGLMGSGTAAAQSQWTMAFVQRMRELGWTEGRNMAIEYRWAEGRSERFPEIAAEFVRLKVDVILTHNTLPTLAAKQASSAIPVVFCDGGRAGGQRHRGEPGAAGRQRHGAVEPATGNCRKASRNFPGAGSRSAAAGDIGRRRQSIHRSGHRTGSGSGTHAGRSPIMQLAPGYRERMQETLPPVLRVALSVTTHCHTPGIEAWSHTPRPARPASGKFTRRVR